MEKNNNEIDLYDFMDKEASEFFQKEAAILAEHHFSDYVFAIIKRNAVKIGKVIRVYPKAEFEENKNQEWFLACNFTQMLDWMAENKESKTDMYIIGEPLKLYAQNPSFRDYIQKRGLEQYFEKAFTNHSTNVKELNEIFNL